MKKVTLVISDDQTLESRWCLSSPIVLDEHNEPVPFVKSLNVEFAVTAPYKGVMMQFVRADDGHIHEPVTEVETEVEVWVTTHSRFHDKELTTA